VGTAQLVTDALVMTIWRRGKSDALLHHSDRARVRLGAFETLRHGGISTVSLWVDCSERRRWSIVPVILIFRVVISNLGRSEPRRRIPCRGRASSGSA
jgi:hypothetical protein